jgi:hypothetical protein
VHGLGREVITALEDDGGVRLCEHDVVEEDSDHGGAERELMAALV